VIYTATLEGRLLRPVLMIFVLYHADPSLNLLVLIEHGLSVLVLPASRYHVLGICLRLIALIYTLVDLSLTVEELSCRYLLSFLGDGTGAVSIVILSLILELVFDVNSEVLFVDMRLIILILIVLHGVFFCAWLRLVSPTHKELVENLE
jgi:hypothetical protein